MQQAPCFWAMGSNFNNRSFYQLMTSFTTTTFLLSICFRFSGRLIYACHLPSTKRNKRRDYPASVYLASVTRHFEGNFCSLANGIFGSVLLPGARTKPLLRTEIQAMLYHNGRMAELQDKFCRTLQCNLKRHMQPWPCRHLLSYQQIVQEQYVNQHVQVVLDPLMDTDSDSMDLRMNQSLSYSEQ